MRFAAIRYFWFSPFVLFIIFSIFFLFIYQLLLNLFKITRLLSFTFLILRISFFFRILFLHFGSLFMNNLFIVFAIFNHFNLFDNFLISLLWLFILLSPSLIPCWNIIIILIVFESFCRSCINFDVFNINHVFIFLVSPFRFISLVSLNSWKIPNEWLSCNDLSWA